MIYKSYLIIELKLQFHVIFEKIFKNWRKQKNLNGNEVFSLDLK